MRTSNWSLLLGLVGLGTLGAACSSSDAPGRPIQRVASPGVGGAGGLSTAGGSGQAKPSGGVGTSTLGGGGGSGGTSVTGGAVGVTGGTSDATGGAIGASGGDSGATGGSGGGAPIVYSGPLVISKGGTYTGNWASEAPGTPAVIVTTSEPVVIRDCNIRSVGDGVWSLGMDANITVKHCRFDGVNPNVDGMKKGRCIDVGNFTTAVIESNHFESCGTGIRALSYSGYKASGAAALTVRYNRFHNVDGRRSNGNGGYSTAFDGAGENAIGLNSLNQVVVEVAWNEIINEPFKSNVEDCISTYASGGTQANPIKIHDNYVQGGYAPDPSAIVDYSGQMINVGDNGVEGVGYVEVYNNQVVSFNNGGIMVSAGHDSEVHHNRVICARKAADGTTLGGSWREAISLWDYYMAGASTFFNNTLHDNVVNVVDGNGDARSLFFLNGTIPASCSITNTTDAFPGRVATQADELAEYQLFLQKVAANAITLGP